MNESSDQNAWGSFCRTLQCQPEACLTANSKSHDCARRRDFYDILNVSKGASDSQLKRAYRKLALKYHPVSAGSAHLLAILATEYSTSRLTCCAVHLECRFKMSGIYQAL